MSDENKFDACIAASQEHMQQHEETLRQILHVRGHRTGDVHQAEHDGLRDRSRETLEATITQIDGIEV